MFEVALSRRMLLLSRLQGETVGRATIRILRHTDEAPGQLTFETLAHGEVARVRPSESHGGFPKRCVVADRDVGPELTGRGQQGEGEQIGRDHREPALLFHPGDDR